ncbi:PilW family protein [Microbacterium aurum]
MTRRPRRSSPPLSGEASDDGFSLVELIVAGAITVILGAVLASIFIAGATATAQIADRDRASGEVQAISTSLSSSIRNASGVSLTSTTLHGRPLYVVRARIADGATNWKCRAWAIGDLGEWSASGWTTVGDGKDELWVKTYPVNTTINPSTSWGNLAREVDQVPIRATPAADPPTLLSYFAVSGTPVGGWYPQLTWNIGVVQQQNENLGDEQTAEVTGAAVARAYDTGSATC